MATIEVKVPDIGGYDDVPVIELLVKVGDTVAKDQGLATLESDKATMEVPSSAAGVVKELKVKLGDTVSEGRVIGVLEAGANPFGDRDAHSVADEPPTLPSAVFQLRRRLRPSSRKPLESLGILDGRRSEYLASAVPNPRRRRNCECRSPL